MSRMGENQIGTIEWEEFEKAVKMILESTGAAIKDFHVNGKKKITSDDGKYEIDGSVEFEAMGGAKFLILIECRSKKPGNRVQRDEVLAFQSKINSLKAQKGIFFTTSAYQRGAIEYAKKNSIALIQVVRGETLYITKGVEKVSPPKWLKLPKYAGWLVDTAKDKIVLSLIREEIIDRII